jgi:electron transfer flavoprotein alpha subunit
MIAVVVVRDGQLPSGGDETVAECSGRAVLIGSGTEAAATDLTGVATEVIVLEVGDFHPGAWATTLAPLLHHEPAVVLPGSPDGRDLAPRLAALLHRPLYAGAISVTPHRVELTRKSSTEIHQTHPGPEFVATMQPGVRGVAVVPNAAAPTARPRTCRASMCAMPPSPRCSRPIPPPSTWPRHRASLVAAPGSTARRGWGNWRPSAPSSAPAWAPPE